MNHREKLAQMFQELPERGLAPDEFAPQIYRVLWRLGFEVPPPHFSSFWFIFFFHGAVFGIGMVLVLAALILFGDPGSIRTVLMPALLAGLAFGLFSAVSARRRARELDLPSWPNYGNRETGSKTKELDLKTISLAGPKSWFAFPVGGLIAFGVFKIYETAISILGLNYAPASYVDRQWPYDLVALLFGTSLFWFVTFFVSSLLSKNLYSSRASNKSEVRLFPFFAIAWCAAFALSIFLLTVEPNAERRSDWYLILGFLSPVLLAMGLGHVAGKWVASRVPPSFRNGIQRRLRRARFGV